MHAISLRKQAMSLRKSGYSYNYISKSTGLSKATLSDWLANVPYTANEETIRMIGKARSASVKTNVAKRQDSIALATKEAKENIVSFSKRDLFMFGLGLYLGEGNKTHDLVRIVNSDPRVIKIAIAWFRSLGVSDTQFVCRLHLYPDSDLKACLQFWQKETTIPRGQFFKPHIDRRTNKKTIKRGRLPHGTLHVGVKALGKKEFGSFFSRKILALIEEVYQRV